MHVLLNCIAKIQTTHNNIICTILLCYICISIYIRSTKGFEILPKKRVSDVETNHSVINCRASKHFDLCGPLIVSGSCFYLRITFWKKKNTKTNKQKAVVVRLCVGTYYLHVLYVLLYTKNKKIPKNLWQD